MASQFLDTLQNIFKSVQENAGSLGIDLSNARTKAEGYSIALSGITGTPWETAFSPEKSQYIIYPRDVSAVRKWVETQAKKKGDVSVQWWESVSPFVMKAALPYGIGIFAAGFIVAKILK